MELVAECWQRFMNNNGLQLPTMERSKRTRILAGKSTTTSPVGLAFFFEDQSRLILSESEMPLGRFEPSRVPKREPLLCIFTRMA